MPVDLFYRFLEGRPLVRCFWSFGAPWMRGLSELINKPEFQNSSVAELIFPSPPDCRFCVRWEGSSACTFCIRHKLNRIMKIALSALAAIGLTVTNLSVVSAAPEEDRISSLPNFGAPPTAQYSGYLDGTDGCDTSVNGDECKIHVSS